MTSQKQINFLLLISLALLSFIILSMVITVVAQDESPLPVTIAPIELGEATPPSEVMTLGLDVLLAALLIPGTAPLVNLVTALSKRFLPSSISGAIISITATVVIYVGFWLAVHFNMETKFETSLNAIYQIGTVILGIVSTKVVAHKAYSESVSAEIPILGYSRSQSAMPVMPAEEWQG